MGLLRHSIRSKLIVMMLISTLLPIATSIVITHLYTKESLRHRAIMENNKLISEGKTNISNYLDDLNKSSLILYSNKTLENIMTNGMSDERDESYIYSAMQLMSEAVGDIYQVYLSINRDSNAFLMKQNAYGRGRSDMNPSEETSPAPYAAWMEPTHPSKSYHIPTFAPDKPELVFTFHRPLYRVPNPKQEGLVSIDVKLDALRKLSASLYEEGKEQLYIIDRSGTVIFDAEGTSSGQMMNEEWMKDIWAGEPSSGSMEWSQSDSGVVIYSRIAGPVVDWMIVKRIPDSHLYESARQLTRINTLVAVISLVIATGAILSVSIRFSEPLKKLIRSMNKIQAGKLDEPIDVNRKDEFGILAVRFRTMMTTINQLILREYKQDLANKTMQLKMLQAQINPHFLNNALQMIGNTALENNAAPVYSLISSLGQMMHYSMNTEEATVPLFKEIDYVNYYLVLQQERFINKLEVEMDIDERTKDIMVPKMIVQPLVENYFKHGFHTIVETGVLRIVTRLENEVLIIIVEDNGAGMPKERLARLQDRLSDPRPNPIKGQEGNVGLLNVITRLRLYCGEDASMIVTAVQPHGIRTTLIIPIKHKEELA